MAYLGRYLNGKPTGKAWIGLIGGAYIYGTVDRSNPGTISDDSAAYLYTGFLAAIVGKYRQNYLKFGQAAFVTKERCRNGIKEVEFSQPTGDIFSYKPPDNKSYGNKPTVPDPYETLSVYVKESSVASSGEGLFASRDIPRGDMVALYNGHKYDNDLDEMRTRMSDCDYNSSKSEKERHRCLTYRYTSSLGFQIDLPEETLSEYKASSGHKANHAFGKRNNVGYAYLDHPRFGLIMSVIALRNVKRDEELCTSYGYSDYEPAFDWYFKLKKQYEDGVFE